MSRLAKAASDMRAVYDVIIIGSGYGGGVAASRLARAGLSVCVLERGREILPGEFPDKLLAAQAQLQLSGHIAGKTRRLGAATALFDMRFGDGVHVLSGCGLGGTSLINANVCLAPHESIMHDPVWPTALRCDRWLNVGYHRARAMLRPLPLPEESTPQKLKLLETAAAKFDRDVVRVPLHIAFEAGETAAGVEQPACTQCGDCMGGCNVGAKTTVHSTYLADAVAHGADLFTRHSVRFIERLSDQLEHGVAADSPGFNWRVIYTLVGDDDNDVKRRALHARMVVVAAGTLGSNEIMLRSADHGLALSPMLGRRVSTNADAVGVGYNNDMKANGVGTGAKVIADEDKVGPAVCGMIDVRKARTVDEQLVIVEAAVQSAMAPLMPLLLSAGSVAGVDMDQGLRDRLHETARTLESLALGAYEGAVANTQTFLAIGNDDSAGTIGLVDDQARLSWPDAAASPVFARIESAFKAIIKATGGTYLPNPLAAPMLGGALMTVHPLGGCVMGETAATGVVDHKCRVFKGPTADTLEALGADGSVAGGPEAGAVHEGLFICDGSVLPRSVGVHPLLTITAVAERAMALLAREKGWQLSLD